MRNFLLEKSLRVNPAASATPSSARLRYDRCAGAWVLLRNGAFASTDAGFRKAGTKKEDRETGEDKKGK